MGNEQGRALAAGAAGPGRQEFPRRRVGASEVLKQGQLEKEGHLVRSIKLRDFVLRRDTLTYAEGAVVKGSVPLLGAELLLPGPPSPWLHVVKGGGGKGALLVRGATPEVTREWADALRETVTECCLNNLDGGAAAEAAAGRCAAACGASLTAGFHTGGPCASCSRVCCGGCLAGDAARVCSACAWVQRVRAAADAALLLMRAGQMFVKHGRQGAPKERRVRVSRDGSCIVWHEEAGKEPAGFGDNARSTSEGGIPLSLLRQAVPGQQTPVFERTGKAGRDDCCLSVICAAPAEGGGEGRTLDLDASDVATRDRWLAALQAVILWEHVKSLR
jgi:hypothetical protein